MYFAKVVMEEEKGEGETIKNYSSIPYSPLPTPFLIRLQRRIQHFINAIARF